MADIKNLEPKLPINFVDEIKHVIDTGRETAYIAANTSAVLTYWNIGRLIVEEE